MTKRLIVHIGGAKCGSSAIQAYIAKNADALARSGVLVPGEQLDTHSHISGQQIWFFQNLLKEPAAPSVVRGRLRDISELMNVSGYQTLIVSAENLINDGRFAEMIKAASGEFDVQVVAYLRRQDDYFISAWQQWKLKVHDRIEDYIADKLLADANWDKMLVPWEVAFGRERMTVRRFRRDKLVDGDVVADFMASTGLPTDGCRPLSGAANRSFDEAIGAMASRVRDVFSSPHDNEFYKVVHYLIGDKAFNARRGSGLLTLAQRNALLDAYAPGNERLQRDYFAEDMPSGELFVRPTADDVIEETDVERLQRQADFLTRAVYGIGRRLKKLERG